MEKQASAADGANKQEESVPNYKRQTLKPKAVEIMEDLVGDTM